MPNLVNNPLLAKVETEAGVKRVLDRLLYAQIECYRHAGRVFVQNRMKAVVVNAVGSHAALLAYGNKKAKQLLDYHLPKELAGTRAKGGAKKTARQILSPLTPSPPMLCF